MANEYKGFIIFNTRLTHYAVDQSSLEAAHIHVGLEADDVTPNGWLYGDDDSIVGFYPNTVTVNKSTTPPTITRGNALDLAPGVRAMLETACEKMVSQSDNGCGWELDVDLYNYLNNIDGTDPVYHQFRVNNPMLWTEEGDKIPSTRADMINSDGTLTPIPQAGWDAPKAVKLVPCKYVYAMFFRNVNTGYKLMIALNYLGMHSYYADYTSSCGYSDAGWLYNHVHSSFGTGNINYTKVGGFMLSMIPPVEQGRTQGRFHPEWSIRSENFYDPTMFPIVGQFAPNAYYNATNGSNSNSSERNALFFGGASLVRCGTVENVYEFNYPLREDKGCKYGTSSRISLLVDTKGNVGISSFHNYTYNSNPMVFIGPLYKKKLYDYDTLPQRYLCSISYSCARSSTTSTTDCSSYWGYSAWYSNSTFNGCLSTNITSGNPAWYTIYAAYPAVSTDVYTNYRYSKALYTSIGLIDEDVFRSSRTDGLIRGQTFNDGDWCYFTGPSAESGTTSSNLIYMSMRWNKDENGHETFIDY